MTGRIHHESRAALNAYIQQQADSVMDAHARHLASMPNAAARNAWMAGLEKKGHGKELLKNLRDRTLVAMRAAA